MESWVIVLISAIAGMIIGSIWYNNKVFGAAWLKEIGLTKKQEEKMHKEGMGRKMALMFFAVLVMSTVLFYATYYSVRLETSLAAGFLLWLGLVATVLVNPVLWKGESWKLYWINSLHYLVSIEAIVIVQTLLK